MGFEKKFELPVERESKKGWGNEKLHLKHLLQSRILEPATGNFSRKKDNEGKQNLGTTVQR